MAMKGYHSYRGRQGFGRKLAAFFLVLILIAACAFIFLQRYIIYADDGTFYLDIPFLNNLLDSAGPDQSPDDQEQEFDLIVDPPQDESSAPEDTESDPDNEQTEEHGQSEESEEIGQPAAETYIVRRLIDLDGLLTEAATLTDGLSAAGADGFVFLAKDREGYIRYQSAVAADKALVSDGISREMIAELCAMEGVYTVARISCMRDPIYAFANMAAAGICKSNGYVWYENDRGGHWMDAEKEAARNYVIALAVECAQLGFDELMLENVCYPYRGNLYKIDYTGNTMSKTEALVLFLEELNAALEPYGVRISLLLEENVVLGLADNTEHTGFIPQSLLPLVDAVYVSTMDESAAREGMMVLLSGQNVPALVPIVSEATDAKGWYLTN